MRRDERRHPAHSRPGLRLKRILTPASRYPPDPRALFVLAASAFSGIPMVLVGAKPGSIAAQMDRPYVFAWGLMLALGAVITLIGTVKQTVTGIILEQVGSVAVGGAAFIFAGAIVATLGKPGYTGALLIGGWGTACFWRWGQLQVLLWRAAGGTSVVVYDDLSGTRGYADETPITEPKEGHREHGNRDPR